MKAKLFGTAALAFGTLLLAGTPSLPAYAQDTQVDDDEAVVVTGTRRAQRSAADTPAPVDVISAQELLDQADTDLQNILRTSVPSFNVNTQPISDAATIIRPANLRGLPPDSTLVLVNNKRRHRAAVLTFLGGGLADGSQGPDISVIPAMALRQVEVLRDGAASQYGSDAIAGVMNFLLRENTDGLDLEAEWGTSYEGDGTAWSLAGNYGFAVGNNGFVNITAEYSDTEATSRSYQRDDAAALIAAGNTDVANPAQVWGQPAIEDDLSIFINSGFDIAPNIEAYAFGNYSERMTTGGFFFRNPTNRPGVYAGPEVDPDTGNPDPLDLDNDNTGSVLVGDMTPAASGDCIAGIPLSQGGGLIPDPTFLANVQADDNCWSFVEMFPGGFTPQFGGELEDRSIVIGLRGELGIGSGLLWDASYSFGENQIDFFINNTINASLGPDSPNNFYPGSYIQTEENFNLDFGYGLDVGGLASPINFAFGYEHRSETFEILAGDESSWVLGPLAAPSAGFPLGQGFSSSSNGFGGFTPATAGEWTQENWAVYADVEADVTQRLTLQAAVRHEDFYDTYGETTNAKVGALYHFSPEVTVRSTWSTGFRAPTVGQANVVNVTTQFQNGQLRDEGTIPLSSAAGQFIADRLELETGQRPVLTPEESVNFTFGAAFNLGNWDLTIDYFNIHVEDRIALSDAQDFLGELIEVAGENAIPVPGNATTSQVLNLLDLNGVLNVADFAGSEDLTSFRFFTNSFDTETHGVDIVASTRFQLYEGSESSLAFAFNWTETNVTDQGEGTAAPISDGRVYIIENALPQTKGNVTFNHRDGRWNGLARMNYYGEWFECHLDDYPAATPTGCGLPIDGEAFYTFDFELGFDITDDVEIALGAQNAFDYLPDDNPYRGIAGSAYPAAAPAGFLGGFYYVRTRASF